ncbi:SCL-interrupting locus protein homolog [Cynoglossus semilaevis]|uniref:SCL-interrupting locus protein homolog n=1 Tax=Cynoglossus semilaevis TaxID=244447 RepID=UPI000D62D5E1|nr:SCL-interrupting locus protein [Cynoglossus semilaevis]
MSCPVKLHALPAGLLEEVFTPETVTGRISTNMLRFPKSRSALWDCSPAGDQLRLQLCSRRNPRLRLSEKALRLAQRHVRHTNKPRLHCFFLGSVSVDSDEEGLTVSLDRFDPGRDQKGSSARAPSAPLPGDVLVPCVFSTEQETPDAVVQSEAELHHNFKALHQYLTGRLTLDLSQLLRLQTLVFCSQSDDSASFTLSWLAVSPSLVLVVQPVRPVPIIPTALVRSLTSVGRPLQPVASRQRGFLTMDQNRKLLLLLESDPKATTLPLVGLWLSGVTHIYNPQVFSWCLKFLFSSALHDRVLSETGCFLLVLFADTHRTPQFFQCRPAPGSTPGPEPSSASGPAPGLQLDCELRSAVQCVTLYQQVALVESQILQCELTVGRGPQVEIFRQAQSSFNSVPPSGPGLSVSDQDSGVEDEDLSPRPSPSPHLHAPQSRRVQPSVPELSLLMDRSFTSHQRDSGSTHRPPPNTSSSSSTPALRPDRKCPPQRAGNASSSCSSSCSSSSRCPGHAPLTPPPRLHSTPTTQQPQPCSCCHAHSCRPTGIYPSPSLPTPDRQLRLLQAQVQMLLEAQAKIQTSRQQEEPKSTNSVAVGTGSSLFWSDPLHEAEAPPTSTSLPEPCVSVRGAENCDITHPAAPASPTLQLSGSADPPQSPESVGLVRHEDQQSFYHSLMTQLTSRLQESRNRQEVDEGEEPCHRRRSLSTTPDSALSSSSCLRGNQLEEREEVRRRRSLPAEADSSSSLRRNKWEKKEEELRRRRSLSGRSVSSSVSDTVVGATVRQLQQLGVDVDGDELTESSRRRLRAVESAGTLASINPAALLSTLSVTDPTVSSLFPGASVDLSLEANAIALRYLSDSQLSRLSLGGHASCSSPTPSYGSMLSPSDMSLATRKYMRRYGLIQEEEEEEEEAEHQQREEEVEEEEEEAALNVSLLQRSQLIRELRPKMQVFSRNITANSANKENCPSGRPSLVRASSRQSEASVGNILDLSRLRQLPKLF